MNIPLLIRADASVGIGTGHVMRMIALAQAWQDAGGSVVFLCAGITQALEARLLEEQFLLETLDAVPGSREDLTATCAVIARYGDASIPVALDGYQFDADFQLGLKNAGCRLLVMDDYGHAEFCHADWVLNQNITAREELYAHRSPTTQLLLGTKYTLLRREFLKYRGWQREIPETARKVLVTLGGSDPDNITGRVIEAISELEVQVNVVVGGSNPHLTDLRKAVEASETRPAQIQLVINPTDMPGLMARADLAVASAGSTSWELAFMGIPTLYFSLAENQLQVALSLDKAGAGTFLGTSEISDPHALRQILKAQSCDRNLRETISQTSQGLVDGLGAQRVWKHLSSNQEISLHNIGEPDFKSIWEWANDPQTRQNSFCGAIIPWEDHQNWCRERIHDPNCYFWLARDGRFEPIGCVRFERSGFEATISINLAPPSRGKGYGAKILSAACSRIFHSTDVRHINAWVKPQNSASVKAFQNAGFSVLNSDALCKGEPALHLIMAYQQAHEAGN